MNKQQKLLQFKDGDLVHVVNTYTLRRHVMHDCVIVASADGREGGELSLTDAELKQNIA